MRRPVQIFSGAVSSGVRIISVAHIIKSVALSRRFVIALSVLLLLFNQTWFVVAQAQFPSELDIDPPIIDHASLENGVAGELQLFSALVIDDRGIEYVDLYYRGSPDSEYNKTPMEAVAGTSNFAVTLDTVANQSKIEYYIEAADTGGNRVLKGFPFYPLVRNLEIPKSVTPVVEKAPVVANDTGDTKWLYIVIGALAVGFLASSISSGGGTNPEPEEQVPLTINIFSPLD